MQPAVNLTPPKPVQTTATRPTNQGSDTALELGGGALALIALGAGAVALSRRRRVDDEELAYEPDYEPVATAAEPEAVPQHDPIFEEQPNLVAPEVSAFAWGERPAEQQAEVDDGSDRRPGETWIERAHRGPSPANPSVSLKNRLRRAAFFDKRERDVAEGKAEPVDPDAGLPDAMVEAESERELA
jgi:hypothetical protein